MADYNPELQAKLDELERELDVSSFLHLWPGRVGGVPVVACNFNADARDAFPVACATCSRSISSGFIALLVQLTSANV